MIKSSLKIPLLVTALIVVLLALAWLPGQQQVPVQQRPYVELVINYDTRHTRLRSLAEDIRYRMNTHHEYRLLSEQRPQGADLHIHQVAVNIGQDGAQLWIDVQVNQEQFRVDGPLDAASSLSAKVFSLINNALNQA